METGMPKIFYGNPEGMGTLHFVVVVRRVILQ
jgi:hypothetical protein